MASLIQDANDKETGEACLDSETGERNITSKNLRKINTTRKGMNVVISTNDETGEPEWVYQNRSNAKSSSHALRKFHIPLSTSTSKSTKLLKNNEAYLSEDTTNQKRPKMRCILTNPIFVFISMVFFYPALAVVLGLLLELSIHAWFHRRDETLPPEKRHQYRIHRSPVNKFLSEFCAVCQSDRMVYMVGKIQDARQRMKGATVGSGRNGCGMPGTQVLTTG